MTNNILRIDSSIFGARGASYGLSDTLVSALTTDNHSHITHRVLRGETVPHFSAATIADIGDGKAELADTLIAELQTADTVVLGVPMYNFGIPSELKAWFDHVARAGVTFEYTSNGPQGLLTGKKVYVVLSRGGLHKGKTTDIQTSYLRVMLGFLGLSDVEFIYAEGLNLSGDSKAKALEAATQHIHKLVEHEAEA